MCNTILFAAISLDSAVVFLCLSYVDYVLGGKVLKEKNMQKSWLKSLTKYLTILECYQQATAYRRHHHQHKRRFILATIFTFYWLHHRFLQIPRSTRGKRYPKVSTQVKLKGIVRIEREKQRNAKRSRIQEKNELSGTVVLEIGSSRCSHSKSAPLFFFLVPFGKSI